MTSITGASVAPTAAPAPTRGRVARRIWWGVMTFFALGVGAYAVALVASGFRLVPGEVSANSFPTPVGLRVHIVAAGLALLTGPLQFARALRSRFPRVHRWTGRIYVLACVVGGISGTAIALFSASGLVAGTGFFALGLCWLTATTIGFRAIRAGDVARHQRWMIRSFALTYAAVMLRIYVPLATGVGFAFAPAYTVIAWLCWVPNLLVAQVIIARRGLRP